MYVHLISVLTGGCFGTFFPGYALPRGMTGVFGVTFSLHSRGGCCAEAGGQSVFQLPLQGVPAAFGQDEILPDLCQFLFPPK